MGTKRKASQAILPVPEQQEQQVRRSRRNASNDKNDEEPVDSKAVLNGNHSTSADKPIDTKSTGKQPPVIQAKNAEPTGQPDAAPKRGRGRPPKQANLNARQTVKSVIHEKIDFNKDVVPIRTYGKTVDAAAAKIDEPTSQVTVLSKRVAATKAAAKPATTTKILPASRTIKKKIEPTGQRKGNLTIQSPTKIEIRTSTTPVQPIITSNESGGQKRIIINKIIMPPDAYNQMLQQQQNPAAATTPNQKGTSSTTKNTTIPTATTVTNVPVQHLINNLQTNLGPLVLSSGIQVMPNQKLLVTNPPGTMFSTANMIPLQQPVINQPAGSKQQGNLRLYASPPTAGQQLGQMKQLQLPIIIKSIMNPLPMQPGVTLTTTQAKTANIGQPTSIARVNPISSVKPIPLNRQTAALKPAAAAAKQTVGRPAGRQANRTPEKVVVNIDTNARKDGRSKKSRVSFNIEKNTSTSIKPISNDLPLTASNVLLTSTPKQSIIKKQPKVFELPCTPIVNVAKKGTRATVTIQQAATNVAQTNGQSSLSQQVKSKIAETTNATIKYCEADQCNCYSTLPADDLESVKNGYNSLNAPKQQLYIYCTTIKLDEKAKFDFEKYAFYIRTRRGFIQVCGRAFMQVFAKNNLSFVETAHKKFNI